ncbi:GLUG motif-containing protein [uncultured Prevotella sp.]|uniref:GLUG motif-containing protein n=1 Tax=uncultured Prevotella sp. TaxID=159272 RepID=UPI0026019C24|nr:GLUG motif-containing protein [uncultured Prevotella sp.]
MSFDYKTTFFELKLTFPESLSSTVQLSMSGNGLVGKSYVNTVDNAGEYNTDANIVGNINISDVAVSAGTAKVWIAMQPATLSNVVITAVDENNNYYKFDVSGKNSATLVAGKVYAFGVTGTVSTIKESLIGNGKNEANAYQISTLKQLEYVRNQINNANTAFTGKYYKLMSDIEINGKWTPIGINIDKGTKLFKGIFDGGNHSITGSYTVTNNANNEGAGLFGTISNATIKNLNNKANITVTSTLTSGTLGIGAIVGRTLYGSTVENCSNTGTITTNYGLIGGVVGQVYVNTVSGTAKEARIEACWNAGTVHNTCNSSSTKSAGGVIGNIQVTDGTVIDKVIIRGCYSTAKAIVTQDANTKSFAGGIVGNTTNTADNVIEIYACWSAASLKGSYMASIIASYNTNKYSVSNIWFKTVKGVKACSVAANLKEPYSNSNTDTPSADAITYMNNALSSAESAYQFDADGNITKK